MLSMFFCASFITSHAVTVVGFHLWNRNETALFINPCNFCGCMCVCACVLKKGSRTTRRLLVMSDQHILKHNKSWSQVAYLSAVATEPSKTAIAIVSIVFWIYWSTLNVTRYAYIVFNTNRHYSWKLCKLNASNGGRFGFMFSVSITCNTLIYNTW